MVGVAAGGAGASSHAQGVCAVHSRAAPCLLVRVATPLVCSTAPPTLVCKFQVGARSLAVPTCSSVPHSGAPCLPGSLTQAAAPGRLACPSLPARSPRAQVLRTPHPLLRLLSQPRALYFTGLGTDPSVPLVLQIDGRVYNKWVCCVQGLWLAVSSRAGRRGCGVCRP